MAKIKSYADDTQITGVERLLMTNVDNSNATANIPINSLLSYFESQITGGIVQNNIIRVVPTSTQTSEDYDIATVVNGGGIVWEYSEEVGVNGQLEIEETWNVIFKVPVIASYANLAEIRYDYYWLINQGKGVIGLGSSTTLTSNNFLYSFSSGTVSLPNDNNLNPPTVYTLNANDITSPQVVLNEDSGSYVVNSATADTYFVMNEINTQLIPVPTATKIYRFVGANGTYGSGGATSVPADFVLVDSSALENAGTSSKSPKIKVFQTGQVIDVAGGDTIATAVANSSRGGEITHTTNQVLFITAQSLIVEADSTYVITDDLYVYSGDVGDIADGTKTVDDFEILYSSVATSTITPTINASPNVNAIAHDDLNAPEDAVNESSNSYNIDGSADFVFIIYDSNADSSDYKIYKFIGSTGTYGNGGGDTAVNGDFSEITQLTQGSRPIRKTSQLKNDGADGTNPFITANDLYQGIIESGTLGASDYYLIIGNDEVGTALNDNHIIIDDSGAWSARGISLLSQGTNASIRLASNTTNGKIICTASSNFQFSFLGSNLTLSRDFELPDNSGTLELDKTTVNIGDWDMDSDSKVIYAHGLSATEWKTVRDISFVIRDDADSVYWHDHSDIDVSVTATNIELDRTLAGIFDSTDYNSTSYNRGFISFRYTPD